MQLVEHADVLEVIAEYACGTVADACALRGSCKGYRRAVDTTVRRLVYEDQPELRTSRDATLRVHRDSDHLDAVRIALTCDRFPKIARLVVVAFGLDGAKDELHEGEECGPRPVACSDEAVEDEMSDTTVDVYSSWVQPCVPPPASRRNGLPSPALTLQRNVTSAYISMAALTDTLCAELEGPGQVWRRVTQLKVAAEDDSCSVSARTSDSDSADANEDAAAAAIGAERRLARVLRAVGPQLVRLSISVVITEEVTAAIRCCGNLQCLIVYCMERLLDDDEKCTSVCDALIASGAPLVSVDARLNAQDALRLLEAVPTITKAFLPSLPVSDLPAFVAGRMRVFNAECRSRHLPRLERVNISTVESWRERAPNTTKILAFTERIQVADVAASFPVLEQLFVRGVAPDIDISSVRFPATLRTLFFNSSSSFDVTRLVAHLAHTHGPGLAELIVRDDVDITPLTAFTSTLTSLLLDSTGSAALRPLEATIEQLVNLRVLDVRSLPSVRCVLGGMHKHLRSLSVGDLGVPLERLTGACPRLIQLEVHEDASVIPPPSSCPGAWKLKPGRPLTRFVGWRRVSVVDDRRLL